MKFQTAVLTILLGIALMLLPIGFHVIMSKDAITELVFMVISLLGFIVVLAGFIGGIIGNLKKNKQSQKSEDDENRN